MDQKAADFVKSRELAIVGVSKRKFGGSIYRELKHRGFTVYPIHPTLTEFDGDPCLPSLRALPGSVEAAVIAVSPAHADDVVEDARSAGVKQLWFQQGADFREKALMAEAYGIRTVTGKCILLYAGRVTGIHSVHRFLAKVFGKY